VTQKTLKYGSRGPEVRILQARLKAAGYYQDANIDGYFLKLTRAAVEDFQEETARLVVDGIYGPKTRGALSGVLVETPEDPHTVDPDPVVDGATWAAWDRLVELVTSTPCKYVPGRGGFDPARGWIIRNKSGNYPRGAPLGGGDHGFVCSTWTNFVAGYMLRVNELFTPTGGMPALSMLMESDGQAHPVEGLPGATFRGYGEHSHKIAPAVRDLRLRALYDQRLDVGSNWIIAGQSSRRRGWWNYHHTAVFIVDTRESGAPLYRIAADGYRGKSGFSRTPMIYRKIDEDYIARFDSKHRLRCYGLNLSKVLDRPIMHVSLE